MDVCIFCRIVAGELSAYKIYEDDQVLAFLDIKPVSAGHTLVIPKKHHQSMEDISMNDLSSLFMVIKKVGLLLKQGLGIEGYNIIENNDAVAGQVVPHLHFHLIPRAAGDGLTTWPQREYQIGEAEEIIKKISHFSKNL